MDSYFGTSAITNEKHWEEVHPLASVRNDTFKVIRNLFDQENFKVEETTLETMVKKVKDHLLPKPNNIFARYNFFDLQSKTQLVGHRIYHRAKKIKQTL